MIEDSVGLQIEQEFTNLKLKFGVLNFLRLFLFYGAVFFFLTGFIIVIYQLLDFSNYIICRILPLGVFFAISVIALIITKKSMPTKRQLLSLLDRHNNCGGLLIALYETDIGSWSNKLILNKNRIFFKVKLKDKIVIFLLALFFMLFSTLVPALNIRDKVTHKYQIEDEVKDLKEQISTLEEEEIIEEEKVEEIVKNIEEIEKNAIGENPVATQEALEHLQKNLQNEAELAEERALVQMANLEKTAEIAKKMEQLANKMDKESLQNAMQGFNNMLNKLASEDKNFQKMLQQQQKGMKQNLSEKDLRSLQKACNMSKEQLKKMLKRLADKKLLKNCRNGICKNGKARKLSNLDLIKFLNRNCPKQGNGKCKKCLMACLGSGAVSRGPGAAPMFWQRRFNSYKGKFKDEAISGEISSLDDSLLLNESYIGSKAGDYSKSDVGALNKVQAKQIDDKSYTLQPKHRKAVSKFFEREKK